MSVRSRRQKVFMLFIAAIVIAILAGAAGFATGYGSDASKRIKLLEENKALREENESFSGVKADIEATNTLTAENGELKTQLETLTAENETLKTKIAELEENLAAANEALNVTEQALTEAEAEASMDAEAKQSRFMDTLTKWFIIGIIGVLVIMGIMMILVPKKGRKFDDADDEPEDEKEDEEAYEEAKSTGEEEHVSYKEEPAHDEDAYSYETEAESYRKETEEKKDFVFPFETVTKEETDEKTEEIPVEEIKEIYSEEPEQTEIVFPEEEEKRDASADFVPDSLEELMRESIKRSEQ
ncbi:MAG: hypothetical protein Q4G23_00265 [Clostridia bacterium]|nr:hypothetical protein [Clostridia bacterium]